MFLGILAHLNLREGKHLRPRQSSQWTLLGFGLVLPRSHHFHLCFSTIASISKRTVIFSLTVMAKYLEITS